MIALLEIPLALFASGTLAYHLCLILGWSSSAIIFPFLGIAGGYFYLSATRLHAALTSDTGARNYAAIVIACGIVLGSAMLFISRPDADDVQFFHAALLQLQNLEQPFFLTEEIYDVKQLPKSIIETIPFYERSVALVSHALGIDPLYSYQNVTLFITSIGFFLIYTLIYRELGANRVLALIATLTAILFLFLDGGNHRSFGNTSIIRMWQGKVIMWTLIVPLSMLGTYLFLKKPDIPRFIFVLLCSVTGLGLTATGLFLIPAMIFATSLACAASSGFRPPAARDVLLINTASAYSILILGGIASGILQSYSLNDLYAGWGATWFDSLKLVIPNTATLLRNLAFLLVIPLLVLRSPYNRWLPAVTLALILLYTNPLTGPLIMDQITAGSYWRIAYLFPVPLAAGLTGIAIYNIARGNLKDLRSVTALLLVASLTWVSYEHNILSPGQRMAPVWFKQPSGYRFPPNELEISELVADTLENGDHLLAPERIIHIVPLLKPGIDLEAGRKFNTRFVFSNAGLDGEGKRRVIAQKLVTDCRRSRLADRAFRVSVDHGVNALVIGQCQPKLLWPMTSLILSTGNWKRVVEKNGYIFYVKK